MLFKKITGVAVISTFVTLGGLSGAAWAGTDATWGGVGQPTPAGQITAADVSAGTTTDKTGEMSEKEAIELAYKLFPDLPSDQKLTAEFDYYPDNRKIWNVRLDFSGPMPMPGREFYMSINAQTGEVINFQYTPGAAEQSAQKNILTREQAYKAAESFLRQMQPGKLKELKINQDNNLIQYYNSDQSLNLTHRFNWVRTIKGVPIQGQGIDLAVDALTGKVVQYHLNWEDVQLPPANSVIPKEELAQKLVSELGFYPAYVFPPNTSYSSTTLPQARLVYMLNNAYPFFDAQTGKMIGFEGNETELKNSRVFTEDIRPAQDNLSSAVTPRPNQKIRPEVAEKTAAEFFRMLGMPGQVRRTGGGSSSGPGFKDEYWSYQLINDDKNKYNSGGQNFQLEINAYTGEVHGFSNWNRMEDTTSGEKTIKQEQALEKAREMIKKLDAGKLSQIILRNLEYPGEGSQYNFDFVRLVNGVPFTRDGIHVTVDGTTGEVIRYNKEWHPANFQPVDKMMDTKVAAEAFLAKQPLKLTYFAPRTNEGITTGQAVFAYQLNGQGLVDAITGEIIDMLGQEKKTGYDFKNHWAGSALQLLADSVLLPDEESFNPNAVITRRQGLKVLAAAGTRYYSSDMDQIKVNFKDINATDPDYAAIQRALLLGVIKNGDKLAPDQKLTREELAVWLVNGLRYGEIAGIPNKVETPFKDADKISPAARNSVGLVYGLGLMTPDKQGNFRPQDGVTWAEMAVLAVKAAPKLQINFRY